MTAMSMEKNFILVAALMCLSHTVLAETLTGILSDEGEPLTGAAVALINANDNILIKKTHTDSEGRYRFAVKPGNYKLRAGKEEYAAQWVKGITVNGTDVVADITMIPQVFIDSTVVPESDGCE